MTKRKSRAGENEDDEPDEAGENRDWVGEGILAVIGLWLIYSSNWNWLLIGIGAVFAGTPVLQIPAIRIYINNKTGLRIFQVRQSHISGSNVVGSAKEVHQELHYHEAPMIVQPPERESKETGEVESSETPTIEQTPILQPKAEISYYISFKKNEDVAIEVNADYPVSVELISKLEWDTKQKGGRYTAEKYRYKVKNANIEFEARRGGDYVLWVFNDSRIKQQIGVRVWGGKWR